MKRCDVSILLIGRHEIKVDEETYSKFEKEDAVKLAYSKHARVLLRIEK